MARPMIFNFFVMNTPSHITHGTWRMPESKSIDYNNLDTWVNLAKLAESACIDAIFFADVFGLYEESGRNWDAIARNAIQFPISDPAMLISAMAYATKNLGFVYTSGILQQHPFAFARAISTLDHLTKGRVGWNIVTTASKNGSRSMGLPDVTEHDERYRWAEEYVEVAYKLWEGSWEDGAALRDTQRGIYSDPSKVHKINHVGQRYRVEGPHLVEPSLQRTPALFQAGSSTAGMGFAARHAEGAFMISGAPAASAAKIQVLRKLTVDAGRRPTDILAIEGLTFIVGSTEDEARRKEAALEENMSIEAQQTIMGAATGLNISEFDPEMPLEELLDKAPGFRGGIIMAMDAVPKGTKALVKDLVRYSTSLFRVVGTPESIADKLEEYQAAGVDGINIMYMTLPGSYEEFVEYIAPELKRRSMMQTSYSPGALREKLFPGQGPRVNERHPAHSYQNLARLAESGSAAPDNQELRSV